MLALAWEYLTGRAVAKSTTSTDEPEWPPHPDRVFQALVAAWGEHGCADDERRALEWLERAGPPTIVAPADHDADGVLGDDVLKGAAPTVFVATNDAKGSGRSYADGAIGLVPQHRKKAARTFPSMTLGSQPCALRWDDATPGSHIAALERLAARVTYIGHSRSLVRMWVTSAPGAPTWIPAPPDARSSVALRVPSEGRLAVLIDAYGGGEPGRWQRPPWAPEHRYVLASGVAATAESVFSDNLLVLGVRGSTRLGLGQTLRVTTALRATLIKHAGDARTAQLVSGHAADGAPMDSAHVAYAPLAFVDSPHSDGHLLGVALAIPRRLAPNEEAAIIEAVARACVETPGGPAVRLVLGALGELALEAVGVEDTRRTLAPETWSGPATTWRTVTPFVLDRMPPRRHADLEAWVEEQVREACVRQRLPAPVDVELDGTAFVRGVPHARSFPPICAKDGRRKWHTHVRVTFPEAVSGPLMLGAGRFRGYGLFRPSAGTGGRGGIQ